MKDYIIEYLQSFNPDPDSLIKTPLLRAKVMIQLAHDILSDFVSVDDALKAFDILCNVGRMIINDEKLDVQSSLKGDQK